MQEMFMRHNSYDEGIATPTAYYVTVEALPNLNMRRERSTLKSKNPPNNIAMKEKVGEFCLKIQDKLSHLHDEAEGDIEAANGKVTKVVTETALQAGGPIPFHLKSTTIGKDQG